MLVKPTLEEVKAIAAENKYDIVPVSCEILSDFTTPIETMKILKNISTHCYMLESAQANEHIAVSGNIFQDLHRFYRRGKIRQYLAAYRYDVILAFSRDRLYFFKRRFDQHNDNLLKQKRP